MAEMLHNLRLLQNNLELEQLEEELEEAAANDRAVELGGLQPARGLRDRGNPLEDYEDEPFRLRYFKFKLM